MISISYTPSILENYLSGSKKRLARLKEELAKVSEQIKDKTNQEIARAYLEVIEAKSKNFESSLKKIPKSLAPYDVSLIETCVGFFLNDVVLNGKDDERFSSIKEIFRSAKLHLVIYPYAMLETPNFTLVDNIVNVGVPTGILYDTNYLPLIFHEIGHNLFKDDVDSLFVKEVNIEIEKFERRGKYGTNLDNINLRMLNRALFYKRIRDYWFPEIMSDLTGAHFAGFHYMKTFVMYQLNKAYLGRFEDHPTNLTRVRYISGFLKRENEILADSLLSKYHKLIMSDKDVDIKSSWVNQSNIRELIYIDFNRLLEENTNLKDLKKKTREFINKLINEDF